MFPSKFSPSIHANEQKIFYPEHIQARVFPIFCGGFLTFFVRQQLIKITIFFIFLFIYYYFFNKQESLLLTVDGNRNLD